ncbi:N-acetyl sugar amidotransferase [Gammaproteobacteria bacterium]|nr:N-acetyl sugar amidotransferase [Gammaproteobacteria bacterium]
MNSPYQICSRCVMDSSDPLIEFSENGFCNHCTDYLKIRIGHINQDPSNLKPLITLFDQIKRKGKGKKYDCVIGMSGGVDSSFLAVLAAEHGLRVMCVHLDNGWNSPIAVENIRTLVKRLKFSYSSYVLPWSSFRKVQLAFLQASVPEAETPTDVAIQKAVHDTALKYKISYILSGGNMASEGILPDSWHYNARDTKYSHAILRHANIPIKLFKSQRFGFIDEFYAKIIRRIKTVYPLNHISYDKNHARLMLEQEYDWKYYGSKHGESKYTKFIQTYLLVKRHGIDYRRATLSSEICTDKISREEALKILENTPYQESEVDEQIIYIAKKLKISKKELLDIINLAPRWYFNFPNNIKNLGRMYDLYRFLLGKEKTSNF